MNMAGRPVKTKNVRPAGASESGRVGAQTPSQAGHACPRGAPVQPTWSSNTHCLLVSTQGIDSVSQRQPARTVNEDYLVMRRSGVRLPEAAHCLA